MLRVGVWVRSAIVFAAIAAGCSQERSTQRVSPQVSSSPVQTVATPAAPTEDFYQTALDRAASARTISQSAQSPEDWQLVASRWKSAITALKQVPKSDPNRKRANQKLSEFQQALSRTEDRAARTGKEKIAAQDPGIRIDRAISAEELSAIAAQKEQGIRVPIKYRKNRIPVIDVVFNGNQRYEMMVDTGASATMITAEMARRLGVRVVGEAQAMTAAGVTTVRVAVVQSITVAGSTIREVPVSIGPLDVGLLGHDFFGNCDISISRDHVEFRQCNVL
ncbi:retropepsin-like aspartic protease [Leptolyngbya sp. FACHB-17]|uniref:retropepsin-like aspartic protease family protein n=1 Tax=unclassified Leptolyngbya TaxID=2650499 RepID=UPI001681747F|nr:retropepsin-like aspartic protease [Leptolyngbya sp. FACHB-17]MBD2082563.1 retroviral-like aspartic protease family protein [Leptolyngbya sp. FACHB-17]